jgi:hypothetical protein
MRRLAEIGGLNFTVNITFYDGIKTQNPSGYLNFQQVYEYIKTSPNAGLIETIRHLKLKDDGYYRQLKLKLPIITPHVEATARKLAGDEFDKNHKSFTQLMYFDIDNVQNVHMEKQRVINQYEDFVALVCISPSGAGISIFIQIENELTKENFNLIWNSIRMNELAGENIDVKANGIGRTMFLSSDPEVYYNPDSTLAVDFEIDEEQGTDPNTCRLKNNSNINSHFSSTNTITKNSYHLYGIDYVLKLINTTSQVEVDNQIVDVKEVPYVALYIPKLIMEGKRHSTLYSMIHHLFYLNPKLEIDVIYSYVWFVNNVFVRPKLDKHDLLRHFNNVVNQIHSSSLVYVNYKKRRIHFNKNCWYLTSNDKMILAKKLTGVYKRHHNKQRVNDAIQKLENDKKKLTNIAIKQITGMDVKTIRNHRKSPDIDLEFEISSIIDEYSSFNSTRLTA